MAQQKKQGVSTLGEIIVRLYNQSLDQQGRALAAAQGSPLGGVEWNDRTKAEHWFLEDPEFDKAAALQAVFEGQMTPEEFTAKRYPARADTYTRGFMHIDEIVAEAARIRKLAEAKVGQGGQNVGLLGSSATAADRRVSEPATTGPG